MPAARRLILIRHARAEGAAASDRDRRLTAEGRRDAAAAGRWLRAHESVPDRVLVSAATRTQETWQVLADAAGWSMAPEVDAGLYSAGPETVLDLVRETSPEDACVVVVGHNPTVAQLVQLLDDGTGERPASEALADGYPTCTIAVLDVDGDWDALGWAGARLQRLEVARG